MRIIKIFSILLIISVISCKEKTGVDPTDGVTDSIPPAKGKIISSIGETLIPSARKAVSEWQEYQEVDTYLMNYYSITISEALNNAQELSEMVTFMRDSIRVETLNQPSVIARINVFQNEALRLADMAKIPSIKDEEVKDEIKNILEVFEAFNSKINTIYRATDLQESLDVDTETPVKVDDKKEDRFRRPVGQTSSKKIGS